MYILIILVSGLILRLISLNQSLWLDEGTTALVAKMLITDIFTKFLPGDFHPPLYYLIIKVWTALFGFSEISLRTPSVIFGIGTIYLVYMIGKKISDKNLGLLAAAFVATSGLFIYYSQEARMYVLVAFLACITVYSLLQKKWILFSISLMLIGMADYVAVFMLPVLFIFDPKNWKKILICSTPLIFIYFLWLPIFAKQIIGGLSVNLNSPVWWQILGETSWKNLVLIPVKFIFGRVSIENKLLYAALDVGVSFVLFLMILNGRSKNNYSRFLWMWFVIPITLSVLIGLKIPILSYFRLLYVLPALYLLLAGGILTLKKRLILPSILFVLAVNILSSFTYLLNTRFQREDWRGLVKFVESNKNKNSITIFVANGNMEAYRYYAPDAKIAGPVGISNGYEQIWLMRYLKDVFDPIDDARFRIEGLGYKKTLDKNFNGVEVWEYTK